MSIKEAKFEQIQRIKEICTNHNLDFNIMEEMLTSAKTKKLIRRNNYHMQKISDLIDQAAS